MYKEYNLTSKSGKPRVVTEFPWVAKQVPCPWDDNKFARVMIPYNATEQRNHKHLKQHTQIVRRDRLSIVRPEQLRVSAKFVPNPLGA